MPSMPHWPISLLTFKTDKNMEANGNPCCDRESSIEEKFMYISRMSDRVSDPNNCSSDTDLDPRTKSIPIWILEVKLKF